jgi:hypothetical protein
MIRSVPNRANRNGGHGAERIAAVAPGRRGLTAVQDMLAGPGKQNDSPG